MFSSFYTRFSLFVLFALMLLYACKKSASYTTLVGEAQGTTFQIVYHDIKDSNYATSMDSIFRVIDHSMSVWDPNSIVSAVNNNKEVVLDEHFKRVYFAGKEIHKSTNGVFDMTVGPLVRRWGFSFKENQTPPDSNEVKKLATLIGMEKTNIEGNTFIKKDPKIEIDFNAIAQGYTVDLIADFFTKRGIEHYMIEVGGEVIAKGLNSSNQYWNLGIDKPLAQEAGATNRPLQAIVPLKNKALVTSGSYRKFLERDGRRYSHAINPKTGKPVEHNLLSVSVLAPSCMGADAYATAFLVMGLEAVKVKSKELGLEVYCVFEKEDKSLGVWASDGFEVLDK